MKTLYGFIWQTTSFIFGECQPACPQYFSQIKSFSCSHGVELCPRNIETGIFLSEKSEKLTRVEGDINPI